MSTAPAGNGVKLTKRKGMTVFKYTQVRKYTHIPPDFLLQMRSWFYQQKFKIKKNTRGHGHLAGRKDGIHVNFVPKFLVSVKNYADHAEVTFSYAARIRKIGIATAVLTEGLSLIVGAVTLTSHIASARGFVDAVTDVMDAISGAPFEVRWLEATEAPGSETATTTTTVTRSAPAITAPVVTPVSPPPLPPRIKTPQAPVPNLMDAPVVLEKAAEPAPQQQQPQIIVVPQSTIVIQAPMGYPYGAPGGYHQALPYPQQGAYDSFPASNPFASATANNALPQIAYQSSTSQLPIGEPTVPVMMERPVPLTSTRYPMPYESSNNTPFSSANVPSSSYSSASSAPLAQAAPQKPLAIEYPTMQRTSSASSLTGAKMPEISANTFSLDEPMFPQKQQMAAPAPNPFAAYGSARN